MLLLGSLQACEVGAYTFIEMQMLDKIHSMHLKQVRLSDGSDSHRQTTQSCNHDCQTENEAAYRAFDHLFTGCIMYSVVISGAQGVNMNDDDGGSTIAGWESMGHGWGTDVAGLR